MLNRKPCKNFLIDLKKIKVDLTLNLFWKVQKSHTYTGTHQAASHPCPSPSHPRSSPSPPSHPCPRTCSLIRGKQISFPVSILLSKCVKILIGTLINYVLFAILSWSKGLPPSCWSQFYSQGAGLGLKFIFGETRYPWLTMFFCLVNFLWNVNLPDNSI